MADKNNGNDYKADHLNPKLPNAQEDPTANKKPEPDTVYSESDFVEHFDKVFKETGAKMRKPKHPQK